MCLYLYSNDNTIYNILYDIYIYIYMHDIICEHVFLHWTDTKEITAHMCAGFVFLVMLLFKWIVPGQYRPNWMNLFWICVPPGSFSFFGNTVLRNQSPGATATFFNPGSARRGVCRLVRNALMKTVFLKPMVARHHYTYHVGRYIYMILQHIAWYVSENDMFMIFMVDLNRLPSDCALMAGIWILLCLVVASGMVPWLNENCQAATHCETFFHHIPGSVNFWKNLDREQKLFSLWIRGENHEVKCWVQSDHPAQVHFFHSKGTHPPPQIRGSMHWDYMSCDFFNLGVMLACWNCGRIHPYWKIAVDWNSLPLSF